MLFKHLMKISSFPQIGESIVTTQNPAEQISSGQEALRGKKDVVKAKIWVKFCCQTHPIFSNEDNSSFARKQIEFHKN